VNINVNTFLAGENRKNYSVSSVLLATIFVAQSHFHFGNAHLTSEDASLCLNLIGPPQVSINYAMNTNNEEI
jgi:hypothetical protein